MEQMEFYLSNPPCLSIPVSDADKLLGCSNLLCMKLYLYLLRAGKSVTLERASEDLGIAPADLKKAAKAAGDKSIALVPVKELLSLTGYIRGGCSPVGMKKKYPTYIDEVCLLFEEIAVSAGERGHQMILPPQELVRLVDAKLVDIIV